MSLTTKLCSIAPNAIAKRIDVCKEAATPAKSNTTATSTPAQTDPSKMTDAEFAAYEAKVMKEGFKIDPPKAKTTPKQAHHHSKPAHHHGFEAKTPKAKLGNIEKARTPAPEPTASSESDAPTVSLGELKAARVPQAHDSEVPGAHLGQDPYQKKGVGVEPEPKTKNDPGPRRRSAEPSVREGLDSLFGNPEKMKGPEDDDRWDLSDKIRKYPVDE